MQQKILINMKKNNIFKRRNAKNATLESLQQSTTRSYTKKSSL